MFDRDIMLKTVKLRQRSYPQDTALVLELMKNQRKHGN